MLKIELQIKRFQLETRKHAALMREINRRVMERQFAERVPRHFEMEAYSRYKARPRASKYNKNKMRKKHHQKPNVYSGRMRKSLRAKITATQYMGRLRISARITPPRDEEEWAKLSKSEKAKISKQQPRLAQWQKEEIARMSREEIAEERKRQASEYRRGALGKYKRIRRKRMK